MKIKQLEKYAIDRLRKESTYIIQELPNGQTLMTEGYHAYIVPKTYLAPTERTISNISLFTPGDVAMERLTVHSQIQGYELTIVKLVGVNVTIYIDLKWTKNFDKNATYSIIEESGEFDPVYVHE